MTSRRVVVSVSVAAGVLGLSACSSQEPSGLPAFTPSASSTSSTPTPSPTSTSKWTPEQQQVIDGYTRFRDLYTAIWTKAEKIDMAKARQVATEPFATVSMKGIDAGISVGYVQKGMVVNTILSVAAAGDTATIKTCKDESRANFVNPGNPSAPRWSARPLVPVTVSLARKGHSWLVSGLKDDEGTCVSG
jgi:hypothetical protein